jgi:hypothetical protein
MKITPENRWWMTVLVALLCCGWVAAFGQMVYTPPAGGGAGETIYVTTPVTNIVFNYTQEQTVSTNTPTLLTTLAPTETPLVSQVSFTNGVMFIVTGWIPTNTVAATITGTVQVGSTLTADLGTWSEFPVNTNITYQWLRGGVAIEGAVSNQYVLANDDVGSTVELNATRMNVLGSALVSAATGAVPAPHYRVVGVTVSGGGSGYAVSDSLTVDGGTAASACQISVTSVNDMSANEITDITIGLAGDYTVKPSNPVSVTGGTGSGASFDLTWEQFVPE